jgi:hypothetical protein
MTFKEVQEKIEEYAKELAQSYLEKIKEFNNDECTESTNQISHKVCEYIKSLETDDKYIVNTTLFEKGNLGITMSGTCIWDTIKDGFININEESDKLIIVISIWGLSTD